MYDHAYNRSLPPIVFSPSGSEQKNSRPVGGLRSYYVQPTADTTDRLLSPPLHLWPRTEGQLDWALGLLSCRCTTANTTNRSISCLANASMRTRPEGLSCVSSQLSTYDRNTMDLAYTIMRTTAPNRVVNQVTGGLSFYVDQEKRSRCEQTT
ncbi:hypothetical protein HCH54_005243 [Aspergillus fumigatus]